MYASRTAPRAIARAAARNARTPLRQQARFESNISSTQSTAAKTGGTSGLVGGLAGGALVFAAGYGYYHFSGAKTIVNTASQTKAQFQSFTDKLSQKAPEPNQAVDWLRSTANSYAVFIPGAKSYIDSAFDELEEVQKKHGKEVESIVKDTYDQLKDVGKNGVNLETVGKAWDVLQKAMEKIKDLAGDLGDEYAPKVKGMGEEAWKKGMDSVKPYLDKNPKVKQVIEENADSLKSGNVSDVFEKVKKAVETGDVDELKKYVKDAGEKAKNSSAGQQFQGGIEQLAKMIPGGSEIVPKLKKLEEVAKTRGDEAKGIMKKAYEDIVQVLQKRTAEVEKLAEKTKEDSKK